AGDGPGRDPGQYRAPWPQGSSRGTAADRGRGDVAPPSIRSSPRDRQDILPDTRRRVMSLPASAIDLLEIDEDITLRRMVLRSPNPKGTVLLLHRFPETLYAWKEIASALTDDFEIHAFDWPGYGLSSRPTVERFSYAPKEYARVLDGYVGKAGI